MEASHSLLDYCCTFRGKEIDSSRTLDTYLEDASMGIEDELSLGAARGRAPGGVGGRRNSQAMV